MKTLEDKAHYFIDDLPDNHGKNIAEIMADFAKQQINKTLKEASEKVQMIVYDGHNKTNSYSKHIQMGVNNAQIDKESILSLQIKDQ